MEPTAGEVMKLESVQSVQGDVAVRLHPIDASWVLLTTRPGEPGDIEEGILSRTLDGFEYTSHTGAVATDADWRPLIDQALSALR